MIAEGEETDMTTNTAGGIGPILTDIFNPKMLEKVGAVVVAVVTAAAAAVMSGTVMTT